jgi:hypothetical protein
VRVGARANTQSKITTHEKVQICQTGAFHLFMLVLRCTVLHSFWLHTRSQAGQTQEILFVLQQSTFRGTVSAMWNDEISLGCSAVKTPGH